MFNQRIRPPFKVPSLEVLAVLLVSGWFLHFVDAQAQVSQKSQVRDLQEQRLATLREVAKLASQSYQSGQTSSQELWSAIRARDEAELDLCTSSKERIAALEKLVGDAKEIEEQNAKLAANHLISQRLYLKAKADRLEQEIRLEQAANQ